MFVSKVGRDNLVIPNVNKEIMSFKGRAILAKMTSPAGKLDNTDLPPDQKSSYPITIEINFVYLLLQKILYLH